MVRKKKGKTARRKVVKSSKVKKDNSLPPPEVWDRAQDFLAQCSKLNGTALRMFIDEAHELIFGEGIPVTASTNMAKAKVGSELQYGGFMDAGCVRLLSSRFLKNRKALHAWNLDALDSRLRDLIEAGEVDMATAKKKNGTKKKRGGTITAFVIALMRKRMGTNLDTIAKVAKAFPDSKWNVPDRAPSLLGWHKSEFRKGERWDGGRKQTIDQPNEGRSESKRKVVKKKGAKKAPKKAGRKKVTRKKVKRAKK